MFENIGKKIKGLAKFVCWLGIIASVIGAIICFALADEFYSQEELFITYGFILLIVGPLSSWISSFFTYGFGELIDKTGNIEKYIRASRTDTVAKIEKEEKLDRLANLRAQGLISEEEYQNLVAKESL